MLQPIAPIRKNGRRRPMPGIQVRSLMAPMSGWMIRPVTGPARFSSGSWSGLAFSMLNTGLMAVCCSPKLY